MNAQPTKRLTNGFAVCVANKSNQHDVTTQLAKYARDIASLSAGLRKNGTAALNSCGLEVIDLKNAVNGKIGTNDEKHSCRWDWIIRGRMKFGDSEQFPYFRIAHCPRISRCPRITQSSPFFLSPMPLFSLIAQAAS